MATKKTTPKTKTQAKAKSPKRKTAAAETKTAVKKATSKPAAKKVAAKKTVAKKPVAKKPVAKKAAAKKPVARKAPAKKPAPAKAAAPKKAPAPVTVKPTYKRKEYVVYPSHGVGQITNVENREVAGVTLALYVVNFAKDKMTLRVPIAKAKTVGMRRLSPPDVIKNALHTLRGRARIKRTMWSRRAQEYEAKINSGDLISLAEVVRDLHRGEGQPEQSYSERQLYEAAIERMSREVAVANGLEEDAAMKKIEGELHQDAP